MRLTPCISEFRFILPEQTEKLKQFLKASEIAAENCRDF